MPRVRDADPGEARGLTGSTYDPNTPATRWVWSYAYDPIGNRTSSSFAEPGQATMSRSYGANALNQYKLVNVTAGGNPAKHRMTHDADGNLLTEFVSGDANCDGDVDFFDIDAFVARLGCPTSDPNACNTGCPWQNSDLDGDGDVDFFDLDPFVGSLGAPGLAARRYAWDAENRLTAVEPLMDPNVVDPNDCDPNRVILRVLFRYDYIGRRVEKRVERWSCSNPRGWVLQEHRKFVWAGWLLLMELDANNSPTRKYTWGLDLAGQAGAVGQVSNLSSGFLEAAGGIGGLVAMEDLDTGTPQTGGFVYCYDGNGNVVQVLDVDDGSFAVKYEYDPYGTRINAAAANELNQPWRFSTKQLDAETELQYFGYRYRDRERWIARDPAAGEQEQNLYCYTLNAPLSSSDPFGLWTILRTGGFRAEARTRRGDTVRGLATGLRLDPAEYRYWLEPAPDVLPCDVDCVFACDDCKYTVPNGAAFVYGRVVGFENMWSPFNIFTQFWGVLDERRRLMDNAGFHTVVQRAPTAAQVRNLLRDKDVTAFFYAGHSNAAGDLLPQGPAGENAGAESKVDERRYRNAPLPRFAWMELYGCYTADWSMGRMRLGLPINDGVWISNVSPLGVFLGYLGSASNWSWERVTVGRP